ncbi:hypothetical protein [Embleya sp. AB8]|uniref:hypothetical protein n=1 Tax=Embleya sp. AB8 TaxID=3156304 RepID=UPI003C73B343
MRVSDEVGAGSVRRAVMVVVVVTAVGLIGCSRATSERRSASPAASDSPTVAASSVASASVEPPPARPAEDEVVASAPVVAATTSAPFVPTQAELNAAIARAHAAQAAGRDPAADPAVKRIDDVCLALRSTSCAGYLAERGIGPAVEAAKSYAPRPTFSVIPVCLMTPPPDPRTRYCPNLPRPTDVPTIPNAPIVR